MDCGGLNQRQGRTIKNLLIFFVFVEINSGKDFFFFFFFSFLSGWLKGFKESRTCFDLFLPLPF